MSKLSANEAKLESRSVDKIFCSPFLLSAPFGCLLILFDIGFKTAFLFTGCKTSPNASNSFKINSNLDKKNIKKLILTQNNGIKMCFFV